MTGFLFQKRPRYIRQNDETRKYHYISIRNHERDDNVFPPYDHKVEANERRDHRFIRALLPGLAARACSLCGRLRIRNRHPHGSLSQIKEVDESFLVGGFRRGYN